jgi:hypothetical protein
MQFTNIVEQMRRDRLQREVSAIDEATREQLHEMQRKGLSAEIFLDVMGGFLSARRERLFRNILDSEGKDVHIYKDKALAIEELFDYLAAARNSGKIADQRLQELENKKKNLRGV